MMQSSETGTRKSNLGCENCYKLTISAIEEKYKKRNVKIRMELDGKCMLLFPVLFFRGFIKYHLASYLALPKVVMCQIRTVAKSCGERKKRGWSEGRDVIKQLILPRSIRKALINASSVSLAWVLGVYVCVSVCEFVWLCNICTEGKWPSRSLA